MNKQLIIIGASGHGKVVGDIATKMNQWDQINFLDERDSIADFSGHHVIGKTHDAKAWCAEADFFIAVGDNSLREKLQEEFELNGYSIATLIHPSAVIGDEVEIGSGTVVMAGVVINSSSKIGKGCILNTSCSIDHDNVLEDYVHVSPGAHLAGTVHIGRKNWIGIGSIIINNVSICEGCKIGAGAVIVRNINEAGTYVGVPAKKVG